jgi:hypothetical protein
MLAICEFQGHFTNSVGVKGHTARTYFEPPSGGDAERPLWNYRLAGMDVKAAGEGLVGFQELPDGGGGDAGGEARAERRGEGSRSRGFKDSRGRA